MTELTALTLAQARDGLAKKSFSAQELARSHSAAVEKARALNAFVLETADRAADMAKASDARIAKGEARPLEGIPLAVKDMFCTAGARTTACSHILDNFVPTYESTVTANLWRDGAVMLGKTNCDEFAMGSSNETSYYGPVFNPWRARNSNQNLVPGGSSGGSAAAVAGNLCLAATAAEEPPDEPPGTILASSRLPFLRRRQGETTGPKALVSFDEPIANSSMLSLPSITAPASHRLRVTVDS